MAMLVSFDAYKIIDGKKYVKESELYSEKLVFGNIDELTFKDIRNISFSYSLHTKKHLIFFTKQFAKMKFKYFKNISVLYTDDIKVIHKIEDAIYNEKIKLDEEETTRNEATYQSALQLMGKSTISDLEKAIEKFQSISNWKDSKTKITECKNRIDKITLNESIYHSALRLMEKSTISDLEKAIEKFQSISNWKDSKTKITECKNRIDKITLNESIYHSALRHMEKNTISDLEKAIERFQSISSWKDSKTKITECKNRIDKITLNESIYHSALRHMEKNTISDLEKAIEEFQSISNWKDSAQIAKECSNQIDKIKKDKYDEAVLLVESKSDKLTSSDCKRAIALLDSILPYKGASKLIEIYKKKVAILQEEEFLKDLDSEKKRYADSKENITKHSDIINKYGNTVLSLIIHNPYFILGLPCSASNIKALEVKDKIEKYARLKMTNVYKSSYDLKNIENPVRDISNIQSAIVATKDIKYKWLWFSNDEYCCWWESDKLFEILYKNGTDKFDYNLFLACYINLLITDPMFNKTKQWNIVNPLIDYLLKLPKDKKVKILEKHIGFKMEDVEFGIESFESTIVSPLVGLCEKLDSYQMKAFLSLRLITNEKAHNELCSAAIKNFTFICFPLDNLIGIVNICIVRKYTKFPISYF